VTDKPEHLSWSQWRALQSWKGHYPIAWRGILVSKRIYSLVGSMSVAAAINTKWTNQFGVGQLTADAIMSACDEALEETEPR
jgi:hypothetical protein